MSTIGSITSRLRKLIKAENQDAFITDRFLFSVVKKHSAWLLRREDNTMKLLRMRNSFETLDYVELIDVDKVAASCTGIKSNCIIKRSAEILPKFFDGYFGPLISNISSLDGSEQLYPTTPLQYTKIANSKNFKFNKNKYYWYQNGYIYIPNVDWDAVNIEGLFEDDISDYKCEDCKDNNQCLSMQEKQFNVPEYLLGELENFVKQELLPMYQIPADPANDKQSIIRK